MAPTNKLPLEIIEMIANHVEDAATRYNLFQAYPNIRSAIKKKSVKVEFPLEGHLVKWLKEEDIAIRTLVISETSDFSQMSDLNISKLRCVVDKSCESEKLKVWEALSAKGNETIEEVHIQNFCGQCCDHVSKCISIRELRISIENMTGPNDNLYFHPSGPSSVHVRDLYLPNLERIFIQETMVDLYNCCHDNLLMAKKEDDISFGGLYHGCPKLKFINNIQLPEDMIGENRVDEKAFNRKLKAIVLMRIKEENSIRKRNKENKAESQ